MNSLSQKQIDRFWGKVDKEKSEIFYNGTRCWEWIAWHNNKGYGQVWIGKLQYSHRISHEIEFGEISSNLFVLHHCDNTLCCNPSHLFLGTQKDNMADMSNKGRHVGSRKLNKHQVEEIHKRYAWYGKGGEDTRELAKKFEVSTSQISAIVNQKQWK